MPYKRPCTKEEKERIRNQVKKLWENPAYRERMTAAHKGQHSSPATQFVKGQAAWNEGKPAPWSVGNKHAVGNQWNKGIRHSEERKEKSRLSHLGQTPWNKGKKYPAVTGEKNHNWKGGITSAQMQARNSDEYKAWRMEVYRRDHFSCVSCGEKKSIVAHHIVAFSESKSLRFEENNGVTLCRTCHNATQGVEPAYLPTFFGMVVNMLP